MSRPQDKHLIPLTQRPEEDAHAIRSAGGKAAQEKRKQKQLMQDLVEVYSGLPITDSRKRKRLERLGLPSDFLTQKMLIADALMRAAQAGNTYAIQMYLEIIGEAGVVEPVKENNLLDSIIDSTKEDIETDDLPEIQQAAEPNSDVVE